MRERSRSSPFSEPMPNTQRIDKGIYRGLPIELAAIAADQVAARQRAETAEKEEPSYRKAPLRGIVEHILGSELAPGIYESKVENKVLSLAVSDGAKLSLKAKAKPKAPLRGVHRANSERKKEIKMGVRGKSMKVDGQNTATDYAGLLELNALWGKHILSLCDAKVW
jgi:hypothetical protein